MGIQLRTRFDLICILQLETNHVVFLYRSPILNTTFTLNAEFVHFWLPYQCVIHNVSYDLVIWLFIWLNEKFELQKNAKSMPLANSMWFLVSEGLEVCYFTLKWVKSHSQRHHEPKKHMIWWFLFLRKNMAYYCIVNGNDTTKMAIDRSIVVVMCFWCYRKQNCFCWY